jgi:hypothetical protein
MLILPGWAVLSLSGLWRRWDVMQRWIIAVGLSIAFYPLLFYGARWAVPSLTLGPYKMGVTLLLCAAVVGWRMRDGWKEQFAFERLEWVALGIVGLTLFTRLWVIRDQAYPAWSDSLHHTLLTQLTAVQGQLPTTMEPYFPVPLDQYHMGLYSLSATTQWLGQVPAHTALVWTAQALNGLCGLGVYLVLDRRVGRVGAVVGGAAAGLLSHQPAFYVNWGRFTQLSGQTILLIAWVVTWEAWEAWKLDWQEHRTSILWETGLAAVLTGGVFLLHFRVALFYLPLLAMSLAWGLWRARRERWLGRLMLGLGVLGIAALIIVTPALWDGLRVFVRSRASAASQTAITAEELAETIRGYYEFPLSSVPYLTAPTWLMVLAGVGGVIGVVRGNRLTIAAVAWTAVLCLLASVYALGVPLLSVTNLGAVLIMLYLPIGMAVGGGTEELLGLLGRSQRSRAVWPIVVCVLIASVVASRSRVADIEPFRYFVTPEDEAAMDWIRENTPPDALFAVNTYFWLPRAPHGTDAGYWIPYLTGRRMSTGVMLLSLGGPEYVDEVVEMSRAVERLEVDNGATAELQTMGVDYIYIGQRGDFSGLGLRAEQLDGAAETEVVYQKGSVSILQIRTN